MTISLRTDPRTRSVAAAGILFVLLVALVYALEPGGFPILKWVSDLANVLFAFAAAALALALWRAAQRGETSKAIWGVLGLGLLLWAIGELIWAFYELILREITPYPSVADVSWLLGYVPLFVGLFLRFRSLRTAPEPGRLVGGLLAYALLVLVAVVLVIGPIVTSTEFVRPIEKALTLAYPLGDLTLALGVLLVVLVLTGGALSVPWTLLALGFVVVSLADLLYVYAAWNEIYFPGDSVNLITFTTDIVYLASYFIIGLGLFVQGRLQRLL